MAGESSINLQPPDGSSISRVLVPFSGSPERPVIELEIDTRPTYDDFGGLDSPIEKLREIGAILNNPELAKDWSVEVPTGVLLCGPGGVGKTELIRAFSRDIGAVLIEIAVSEIQSMYIGKPNENLRRAFSNAAAVEGRVVLLFDELDGLFSEGAGGNDGMSTSLISEFKTILSSLRAVQPNTIVAGSTNSLDGFDEALLRPGRIDVVIQIPKPNDDARARIFGCCISKDLSLYEIDNSEVQIGIMDSRVGDSPAIDVTKLAAATENMTGADIKSILKAARTRRLMAHIMRKEPLQRVTQDDILAAVRSHRMQRPNIS